MTAPTMSPAPALNRADWTDDDLDHLYCCDPDVALCGANLEDAEDDDEDDADDLWCVVCDDLDTLAQPCSATCGYAVLW